MILKRIFLLLTSALIGVLVSCQNEGMLGNPDATPLDGLNVVLTSELIHTKAIDGAQDTYATPEELRINKAHIVFFRIGEDGRPDEVIGMKDAVFQPEQSKAMATKEKLVYR